MKHTSANVVHSAARQRSTLCRSTTYRAQHPSRDGGGAAPTQRAWPRPACGGVVVGRRSVGRSRPQRAIYYTIVAKENWRTATQDRAPARPTAPPSGPRIRARGRRCGPGSGEGGRVRSAIKNVRRASCGLRGTRGRATPEGRWEGRGSATRGGHGHKERISQNRC